ncbi:hypothetical protein [Streptomyces sp. ERV7]|uniref:hypothetical protein n=1 Tax=Streptomyces sp. ERV7 TaxID=1322334 RepID=UPI000B0DEDA0|nr:hypothetical protein [Streptomyces sp. ERV7]
MSGRNTNAEELKRALRAAPAGEGSERACHLAQVLEGEPLPTLQEFVPVAPARDVPCPVAQPAGQDLDGPHGPPGMVGDAARPLDRYRADRPRDRVPLPLDLPEPRLHSGLVELVSPQGLQEHGGRIPPGQQNRRARAVGLAPGPPLLSVHLHPAGDPGRAQRGGRSNDPAQQRATDANQAKQRR